MKGTVVFDLDYTLVDTARFKAVLAEAPDEALARMPEFVFEGADAVLRRLKADGWKLALLTRGEPGWQEHKAVSAGLAPHFDHALYTAEPKTERLTDILAWEAPLVFVNDNGEEIDAMRGVLPDGRLIAVRGPKAPATLADATCGSLEEVYRCVVSG